MKTHVKSDVSQWQCDRDACIRAVVDVLHNDGAIVIGPCEQYLMYRKWRCNRNESIRTVFDL